VPEYTVAAVAAVAAVVAVEVAWLRTGLLRRVSYWIALAICFAFQVLVDGWLTKLSAPIVLYNPDHVTGWRFPWDIPVEDFLYGYALITLTLVLWERARHRHPVEPGGRR
jgi:lycopene cyclase domain-containing protein